MPRRHREGVAPEPRSTEIKRGQTWKHRWIARTITIASRVPEGFRVTSEGREHYLISPETLYRDYRLVTS